MLLILSLIASPALFYSGTQMPLLSWKPEQSITTCFFFQGLIGNLLIIILHLLPPTHLIFTNLYYFLLQESAIC